MIKAIVFDVDDTLYNQEPSFNAAFRSVFNADIDNELLKQLYMNYQKQFYLVQAKACQDQLDLTDSEANFHSLHHTFKKFDINGLTKETADQFEEEFFNNRENIQLADGLSTIFNQLSTKFKLGIITNGTNKDQLSKIMKLKLQHWISRDQIITSEDAHAAKPDPLIFTMMNRKFDLRGSEMLYVGSSFDEDIVPAKKAGWQTVWYNPFNGTISDSSAIPDQTVSNIEELKELLTELAAERTEKEPEI
ncbi:HAD family hydrolase [Lentilactobacillus sp. SPB1-3]|uniref:HAD family hydrolase n=1 Tax=Lentilactobacillus terminaliae TaxID=3003483 RepID=A0ACD5DC75_9LACO|nr:HAD family hydrolase [Lentilactobacillus sp. SPB1-3]MCZ0977320.1 HAD family hydrolase [Lentilactobacillus sp. SPB1-3]